MTAVVLAVAGALALSSCSSAPDTKEAGMAAESSDKDVGSDAGTAATDAYHKVTADEVKQLIDQGDVTLIDVRTPEEYADTHVAGAINIPNESIGTEPPSELANKDDALVVYCRTGIRSKQAADKLVAMGFTNVNDLGGISNWTGDVVSGTSPDGS